MKVIIDLFEKNNISIDKINKINVVQFTIIPINLLILTTL